MTDSTSAGEPIPFGSNRSKTITLPPDVLRDASRRLGWAALVYSVTFFLAFFGSSYFFHGGPLGDAVVASMDQRNMVLPTIVAVASIAMGIAVFVLSRYSRMAPAKLLDLGLGFLVIGALGISMSEFWDAFPLWSEDVFGTLLALSPENNALLMSYQSTRFKMKSERGGRLAAFRASDGKRLWDKNAEYLLRPTLVGRKIFFQKGSFDIRTGKQELFKLGRSYGCGVAVGSRSSKWLFSSSSARTSKGELWSSGPMGASCARYRSKSRRP